MRRFRAPGVMVAAMDPVLIDGGCGLKQAASSFEHMHIVARIAKLHRDSEIKSCRPAADTCDFQGPTPILPGHASPVPLPLHPSAGRPSRIRDLRMARVGVVNSQIFPKRDAQFTIFSTNSGRPGIPDESRRRQSKCGINLSVTKVRKLTRINFVAIR